MQGSCPRRTSRRGSEATSRPRLPSGALALSLRWHRGTASRTGAGPSWRDPHADLEAGAEQAIVVRLGGLVGPPSLRELLSELGHLRPTLGGVLDGPDLHEEVLERLLLVEVPEDHVQLADDELEHVDLLVEQLEDVLLDRVRGPQVDDLDLVGLPHAVNAPDPLLE